jgi:hypothetical protein
MISGDPYALWDAAYVLGALTSSERREYEEHLAECASCQADVGELSGMPALLAMLSPAEVAGIDDEHPAAGIPESKLLDELVRQVAARRRKARWLTWTAAAAAALLIGLGGSLAARSVLFESPPQNPSGHAMAAPEAMMQITPSSFEATVALTAEPWGTEIEMACTYREEPPDHPDHEPPRADGEDDVHLLALIVVARDGTRSPLATWTAVEGGTAHPTGSTATPLDQIAAVQIVAAGSGDILLQRDL